MASGKNFRQERRTSTSSVMAMTAVFVTLCMIGAWVLNSPSDRVSERAQTEALEAQYNHKSRTPIIQNDEALEQNTGVSSPEDEDKKEEAPQEKSDVISSEPELDIVSEKEKLSKKSSKKPKAENDSKQIKSKDLDISTSSTESAASKSEESVEPKTNTQEKSDLMIETRETSDAWDTQADESKKEKVQLEKKKKKKKADEPPLEEASADEEAASASKKGETNMNPIKKKKEIDWALCEFDGAIDFIPCLDNVNAIKALPSTKHYEHRERHCPDPAPTCLVPLPDGYRRPVRWPKSRNEVWYANVPHPGLISYKKDQNWVKKSNDKLIFPGGGTQFKQGALHYIDYIQESFPKISWGKRTRVILDVGCGVASFGGYIFDRDVLTMSFAPKDEHEAQVQLALERGIPAISSVMGTQRLVFPSNVYDAVHCARCRVPWHIEGGKLLLELNRVLRPGGYFIWSATPVYWTNDEDVQIWKEMVKLTRSICWKLVEKFFDDSTGIGAAVFQKPRSNQCYENRNKDFPPMCDEDDKPDSAWYVPMSACIHRIPNEEDHGGKWPQEWPLRLTEAPAWLSSHKGVYDKTAASDFVADTDRWQRAVQKSYLGGLGIEWKDVRNVMDMRASFGGFAAALSSLPVWVMNVVPSDAPDTLPIIFDRGLFGIYHDWCESFSSYPRTYDLLHADHLFGKIKKSCDIKSVVTEVDRLLRPGGWLIARDKNEIISELQDYFESLRWNVKTTFTKGTEGLVAVEKSNWRPETTF
ncbi:hypothetical protein KP509_01G093300 [Ceratopteris richardii]|uniref:Methyltransferase n=1 Tax=Ceratopteris richardii TaxID=49495 RepID=A0A8T2VNK7_CERRI|nr:hypothetical protein KP509_01G093300 [Ceratopteris richardii]KAH7447141.1 hypothetical protein KP509_01G093300 [Ceratopteris richardii]KAH7447142.1 hypothetical protein KP509_01G093300 [Ceratopteris richardii]KAH7447143.1 hypothetical protein KP509_01G093300 [Ceratopteris richardii]